MNENAPPDALGMALGIEAEPELESTTMSKKKQQGAHAELRKQMIGLPRRRFGPVRPATPDQREDVPQLEDRLAAARGELAALSGQHIDPADLCAALAAIDPVWDHLTSAERARIVRLLIERIDYDGGEGILALLPADSRPLRSPLRLQAFPRRSAPPPSFGSLRRAPVRGGHVCPTAGECGGQELDEFPCGVKGHSGELLVLSLPLCGFSQTCPQARPQPLRVLGVDRA